MRWRDAKKRERVLKKDEVEPTLPDNYRYAGWWTRALAMLIDTFMILTPITILIGFLFGYEALKDPEANPMAGNLQMALYSVTTILLWQFSYTPGKKAMELRILDSKTYQKPPLWKLVVRFASYFLSMISIIGFFIGLFRNDKRALHDLTSGTILVQERD
jgi:uncharacterized RDD family membrane protein YckC